MELKIEVISGEVPNLEEERHGKAAVETWFEQVSVERGRRFEGMLSPVVLSVVGFRAEFRPMARTMVHCLVESARGTTLLRRLFH